LWLESSSFLCCWQLRNCDGTKRGSPSSGWRRQERESASSRDNCKKKAAVPPHTVFVLVYCNTPSAAHNAEPLSPHVHELFCFSLSARCVHAFRAATTSISDDNECPSPISPIYARAKLVKLRYVTFVFANRIVSVSELRAGPLLGEVELYTSKFHEMNHFTEKICASGVSLYDERSLLSAGGNKERHKD
jgi:hypothetical protein